MTLDNVTWVTDIAELAPHYGMTSEASMLKVAPHMTAEYRAWIMASRLCVLTTVGPEGTDGSPRGDDGPVVQELDPQTLLMPDWRGNNRMDSLRNIVADGRVSLMFIVRGSNNVIRVNGEARLTLDPGLIDRFEKDGHRPRSVIVIKIAEIYSQCARALMRAGIWTPSEDAKGLPSMGDILKAQRSDFDAASYDADWDARADRTMWT